jgi:acyl-CoA synthetase (AMP-forming)/AMP-acid ligase II
MRSPALIERTVAIGTVLAQLDVRPHDRVLIMLPDGPGFAESVAAVFYRDAVPVAVNPLLSAAELAAAATQARAQLVLACLEQLPALAELHTQPPLLIPGSHRPWAAALALR